MGVAAKGTPAVCHLDGEDMVVCRGFDNRLYYESVSERGFWLRRPPIATGVMSDPSLVTAGGSAHLAYIVDGTVVHAQFAGGNWSRPQLVSSGTPPGGLFVGVPPQLFADGAGRAVVLAVGRDLGLYASTLLQGVWGEWLRLDRRLSGAAALFVSATFASDRFVVASYSSRVLRIYQGDRLDQLVLGDTFDVELSAGSRPVVVPSSPPGNYRLIVSRTTGHAESFPMLWTLDGSGDWEPIGGIPKVGTSPAAAIKDVNRPAMGGTIVMIERDPQDVFGEVMQNGSVWIRNYA